MADIEIEIDGKALKAQPGQMVIEVADAAGIYIPRFCYHKHLSVAANCRMCLVEVEKVPKALPACATPVAPNMKVMTRSPLALAAQKAVMEFLLINHPLDCPICDQGGECELQDLSLGFGSADSNFSERKRAVANENLGALIATEMTRCIHCTRCVRFGTEVAGLRELGATGRGGTMEIGTYVEKAMQSEISGNIIDLCPVGALTSKPFRFAARAWELTQHPSIAPHDCLGSNINVHTRNGTVMRVVPRENVAINETWLSDRDRFSYEGLYHADRITKPMIRTAQGLQETDWQTALTAAVKGLQAAGTPDVAALATPNATLEEFYLLQKLCRGVGSPHVEHRLRETDFTDQASLPLFPCLAQPLSEIETAEVIILIGAHVQYDQPLLATRIRKAVQRGAHVLAVNMADYRFTFAITEKIIAPPTDFVAALSAFVDKTTLGDKKAVVLLGCQAQRHPQAAHIRALAKKLAAPLSVLTEGANGAGAWIAGAVPHRGVAGRAVKMNGELAWQKPHKSYVLLNVEPEDCAQPQAMMDALAQAECVVALATFMHPVLSQTAQVILPAAAFTETAGTYVNAMGQWQSFRSVVHPLGEARPAWKILRVLGNLFGLTEFSYEHASEIAAEIKTLFAKTDFTPSSSISSQTAVAGYAIEVPIYSGDSVLRRAISLQQAQEAMYG